MFAGRLERADGSALSRGQTCALVVVAGVFLLLRLQGIGAPLLDMHNVRQTQTAMIARNLAADHFNVFHTRIDWAGNEPGYVVQEFPLYQLVVALASTLGGNVDTIGRVISLVCSGVAGLYLFLIARRLFSPTVALWALACFAVCPIGVFLSRAFMINMMAFALSLMAVHDWLIWSEGGAMGRLVRGTVAITLATLVNLTTVTPAVVVIVAIGGHRALSDRASRAAMAAVATFFVAVTLGWNLHAAAVNRVSYPDWSAANVAGHVFGVGASRLALYPWFRIAMYLAYFVLGLHGLILVAVGSRRARFWFGTPRRVLVMWAVGGVAYYLVFFNALRGHNYYSLPIVPVLCLLAGIGADSVWRRWTRTPRWSSMMAGLAFAITLPLWLVFPLAHSLEQDRISYAAARDLGARTPRGSLALVAILHTDVASTVYPTILYYANRRGWNIATANEPVIDYEDVERKREAGARYLLVTYGTDGHVPISSMFPLFRHFAHQPALDYRPIVNEVRRRYRVVSEGPNHLLVSL
jgi:hypothetical protein